MATISLLTTLVGSQAHGLADENSDKDFRGVFYHPTREFFRISAVKLPETIWIEGKQDDTSYEIGHFLNLAVHSNPTVLEVFKGPLVVNFTHHMNPDWGTMLRDLFPYVWSSEGVYNAFRGYGRNQMNKMVEGDPKMGKFAVAWVRSLMNACDLLETGNFSIQVTNPERIKTFMLWKKNLSENEGPLTMEEVTKYAFTWERQVKLMYEAHPRKMTDIVAVNAFLQDFRRAHW